MACSSCRNDKRNARNVIKVQIRVQYRKVIAKWNGQNCIEWKQVHERKKNDQKPIMIQLNAVHCEHITIKWQIQTHSDTHVKNAHAIRERASEWTNVRSNERSKPNMAYIDTVWIRWFNNTNNNTAKILRQRNECKDRAQALKFIIENLLNFNILW